ncbi:hypothetical protein D3C83_85540 [compost metagenome]
MQVRRQAGKTRSGLEAGEPELVQGDDSKTGEGDVQRVAVEDRHADQGQRKQNEIDRNAEQRRSLHRRRR